MSDRDLADVVQIMAADPDGFDILMDGAGTEVRRREALMRLLLRALIVGYQRGRERAAEDATP